MVNPSEEQINILKEIKNCNCVIDSVAGCGKTTTLCMIAMAYRRDTILSLMYNVRQRKNTKESLRRYGLRNIEVHTYHSAAYNLYGGNCMRDSDIKRLIDEDRQPNNYDKYDIIIIDETQDFTDLYYKFVLKMIRDLTVDKCRLVILGDFMQEINVFNGSNIDYILNPELYFDGPWKHLSLTKTFRLTKPMVDLVNAINDYHLNGARVLVSDKQSEIRPKYFVCDTEFVHKKLTEYLSVHQPHEIFILTPSVNKNPHVVNLSNKLTNSSIPVYVGNDKSINNSEAMNGKLVISTIHAVKGGERPIVFLLGFDDSVLPKMLNVNPVNKNAIIYVALTRAQQELLIFHHHSNAFIVPPDIIRQYCDFSIEVCDFKNNHLSKKSISSKDYYCVTDMVKYLSHAIIEECKKYIIETVEIEANGNLAIDHGIPNVVPSVVPNSMEEVADINGFLVPAYHSRFCFNFALLTEYFSKQYKNTPFHRLINGYIAELKQMSAGSLTEITRAATIYNGLHGRLFFKIEQIRDFNWINAEFLNECSARMDSILSDMTCYEVPITRECISGIIDAIDCDTVYEFKCTSMIEDEHLLQLALYAYLIPGKKYKIFNVYTGELRSIVVTNPTRIAEILIR